MRALLILAAALGLSACGNNDQSDNTANVDENLAAENIVANDVTAIDAVTGDAANMAADVDINFTNDMLDGGNGSSGGEQPAATGDKAAASRAPSRPRTSAPAPAPVPAEPPANSTANATE